MNCTEFLRSLATVLILCLASIAQSVSIDDERLENLANEPTQWITFGRDLSQQRFSPLSQINKHTIARLSPTWIFQTGEKAFYQINPIVAEGRLYTSLPSGGVTALNGANGEVIWSYRHKAKSASACCKDSNFGVSLAYGMVYSTTPEGNLLALDSKNGDLIWSSPLVDYKQSVTALDPTIESETSHTLNMVSNISISMAPLVYQGRIYVGVTGKSDHKITDTPIEVFPTTRRLINGFLVAFNAHTGRRLWTWNSNEIVNTGVANGRLETQTPGKTLEKPTLSQSGSHDSKIGGGWIATTTSIDPSSDTIFFGTGKDFYDPTEEDLPDRRSFTNSLVALDSTTGDLRWHFKEVDRNLWGYDVSSPPLLFDWVSTSRTIKKAVAQASYTGWIYILDRNDGTLLARSQPFVPQENLFMEPKSKAGRISPGSAGAVSWSPLSFDPRTGDIFVTATHLPEIYIRESRTTPHNQTTLTATRVLNEAAGRIASIDSSDGRIRWLVRTEQPIIGGSLATSGDLVFVGHADGYLTAYDSSNGKQLWSFLCGAGVNAPPISFSINGEQFIAVAAGGDRKLNEYSGNSLIAFKLTEIPFVQPGTDGEYR